MASKNANFYSVKPNQPGSLKSHRTRKAALSNAGEMGQVWINEANPRQRQVHKAADGTWMTTKPDAYLATDIKALLDAAELLD